MSVLDFTPDHPRPCAPVPNPDLDVDFAARYCHPTTVADLPARASGLCPEFRDILLRPPISTADIDRRISGSGVQGRVLDSRTTWSRATRGARGSETSDENHWQCVGHVGVRGCRDRDHFRTTLSPLNVVHHFASCLPARFQLTFKTTVCYSPDNPSREASAGTGTTRTRARHRSRPSATTSTATSTTPARHTSRTVSAGALVHRAVRIATHRGRCPEHFVTRQHTPV